MIPEWLRGGRLGFCMCVPGEWIMRVDGDEEARKWSKDREADEDDG